MMFVLKLFPKYLAKEAYQAREFMTRAWEKYFFEGSYATGSKLIQARTEINKDFNIDLQQTARIEGPGGSQAILGNTLPSTFWMVYHVFSDPVVLQDIRDELARGVTTTTSPDGKTKSIDLAFVKGSCPILLSTFQEMFRYNGIGVSARIALEDHLLDGKYLLKKGSTVMIPAHVQHTNPEAYGGSVYEFNHKRFVKTPGVKRPNPIAFRGFGGGHTLCPGRHFVTTEIMLFTALMVLRFDVLPVGGKWIRPTTDKSPLVAAVPTPDFDIDIEIRPRDDNEWRVSFSGYDKGLEISAEDIVEE